MKPNPGGFKRFLPRNGEKDEDHEELLVLILFSIVG